MKCPYCGAEPELVTDVELYGRSYGGKKFWLCRRDNAYVGCHGKGTKPLGTMANAELRAWRRRTHEFIDWRWQNGLMRRDTMYRKLSQALGREIHVGEADVEGCKSIIYAAAHIWRTDSPRLSGAR